MQSADKLSWEQAVGWLRSQPDCAELVKACFYDDPLLQAAQRYHASTEWQAVAKLLPDKPGSMLDIGAGRGIASFAFASDGWRVTALEPDKSSLVGADAIRQLSADSGMKIHVEQQWGERLPFEDGVFDLVHARAVLHHAQDLEVLCREAARVLKPGGMILATREHVISKEKDRQIFLERHPLHRLYGGENAYLLQDYLQALRKAGLKLVSVLNPYESDINLYPLTKNSLREMIAGKLHIPGRCIPEWLLRLLGRINRTPGRLYTFVGIKP